MTSNLCDPVVAEVTRGSDFNLSIIFRQSDGITPIDLTGSTPELLDVDTGLTGRLTASIPVPSNGTLYVAGEGSPPLSVGQYKFRARVVGAVDRASPLLVILVK